MTDTCPTWPTLLAWLENDLPDEESQWTNRLADYAPRSTAYRLASNGEIVSVSRGERCCALSEPSVGRAFASFAATPST